MGKSTATSTTLSWIKKRIFSRNKDPEPSGHLVVALSLSLLYGLFVSLSDVGFIGLLSCSVPFPSYIDSPGSVRSEADARSLIKQTLIEGVDPSQIKSERCDAFEVAITTSGNQGASHGSTQHMMILQPFEH